MMADDTNPAANEAMTPPPARGGSGRGSSRGGHGRGCEGRRRNDRRTIVPRSQPVFKGNTAEMNGHVFQCFNECDDKKQFTKTVEILGEYIAKNLKYPGDMTALTKDLTKPVLAMPNSLSEKETDLLLIEIWKKQVAQYCVRVEYLESNLKTTYAVIYGQCSEPMKAKLKSLDHFDERNRACDCVWILKQIKGITFRFEGQRFAYLSLDDARTSYYAYKQTPDESLAEYLDHFRSRVDVLEHFGGQLGEDPKFLPASIRRSTTDPKKLAKLSCDYTLAVSFLKRADRRRFGPLWSSLENQFSLGNDQYPTDLTAAYSVLVSYKLPKQRNTPRTELGTATALLDGMTFAQATNTTVPGSDGVTHERVTCYRCENKGHYADRCPTESDVQLLQSGPHVHFSDDIYPNDDDADGVVGHFSFAQYASPRHDIIPSHWVLLDSQSTVNVFRN